jgi:hypothetical protein
MREGRLSAVPRISCLCVSRFRSTPKYLFPTHSANIIHEKSVKLFVLMDRWGVQECGVIFRERLAPVGQTIDIRISQYRPLHVVMMISPSWQFRIGTRRDGHSSFYCRCDRTLTGYDSGRTGRDQGPRERPEILAAAAWRRPEFEFLWEFVCETYICTY